MHGLDLFVSIRYGKHIILIYNSPVLMKGLLWNENTSIHCSAPFTDSITSFTSSHKIQRYI